MEEVGYEDLTDVISFQGFDFNFWRGGEEHVLKPRLYEKGFKDVEFYMGDFDSFGPLTRICLCRDSEDKLRRFIYG